jgi:hypothetical protein
LFVRCHNVVSITTTASQSRLDIGCLGKNNRKIF